MNINTLKQQSNNYKVEITKEDNLKSCINDSLFDVNKMVGKKDKSIKEVHIEIKSYYFDSNICSGVCLYYIRTVYSDKMHLTPGYLYAKPYRVFILSKNKITYLTSNKKRNATELNKLKSVLVNMPDSVRCDSNLINNYFIQ